MHKITIFLDQNCFDVVNLGSNFTDRLSDSNTHMGNTCNGPNLRFYAIWLKIYSNSYFRVDLEFYDLHKIPYCNWWRFSSNIMSKNNISYCKYHLNSAFNLFPFFYIFLSHKFHYCSTLSITNPVYLSKSNHVFNSAIHRLRLSSGFWNVYMQNLFFLPSHFLSFFL